jgi:hypothetical protein
MLLCLVFEIVDALAVVLGLLQPSKMALFLSQFSKVMPAFSYSLSPAVQLALQFGLCGVPEILPTSLDS